MDLTYYKIRVDTHCDPSLICNGHTKYAYCYENNEDFTNPHTHFYLETTLKRDSIVKRIKKLEEFKPGNGFYSCRELHPDTDTKFKSYLAYLLKQNDAHFEGFSSEEISEIKQYNDQVKAEIKERKAKKKPIIDQIIDHYKYDEIPPTCYHQVITDIIEFYKDQGKLVREFAMVSQVQTLLLRYVDDYKYTLSTNILKAIDKSRM